VQRRIGNTIARYAAATLVVFAIVAFYRRVFHVNPTTVGFTFLIAVLLASANWGFRLALYLAVVATAAYNFFFLPPIGTFTIADPQNWVALFSFLLTALIASNLANRARTQTEQAKRRRVEVERLYSFSQQLLTADNVVRLLNRVPSQIVDTFGVSAAALMLVGKSTVYRSSPSAPVDAGALKSVLVRGEPVTAENALYLPLRVGVRVTGALAVVGGQVARETLEAICSLAGIAIERARAVEELTKNQAMQESERLRSALLDSVAHEFRTPLTGIKASVTSLLSGCDLNEEQRGELLTVIDEETDRLNRLVGEAAEMAQLDSRMFKLNLEPHCIKDVVEAALQSARSALQKHTVEVDVPDNLPELKFDFERIREVLLHLLENAGKYAPAGTPVRVSAELKNGQVVTSVADRGPGIDPFEQTLIFDKFYRGRDQRFAAHGTGMGLAIAKVIVEAHRGKIEVISQPGKGAVFSFSLPVS
jgi:two-component system, OmpR family, sensor histidine kinase KdpD